MKWSKIGMLFGWVAVCLMPCSTWGWFDAGHETVANIAESRLTDTARKEIERLIAIDIEKPGTVELSRKLNKITSSAIWADYLKQPLFKKHSGFDPYGEECHYIDVKVFADEIHHFDDLREEFRKRVNSRAKSSSRHALSCLRKIVKELRSSTSDDVEKAIALRYFIHIVGDIHEPMHTLSVFRSTDSSSGNRGASMLKIPAVHVPVKPFRPEDPVNQELGNLHYLWDAGVGVYAQLPYTVFRKKSDLAGWDTIDKKIEYISSIAKELMNDPSLRSVKKDMDAVSEQRWEEWIFESLELGVKYGYQGLDLSYPGFPFSTVFLDYNEYKHDASYIVKRQFLRGGLRLGALLNALFHPERSSQSFRALIDQMIVD